MEEEEEYPEAFGLFFRSPPPPPRVTLGVVPTKFLFLINSYESVYGLARLHSKLHTISALWLGTRTGAAGTATLA